MLRCQTAQKELHGIFLKEAQRCSAAELEQLLYLPLSQHMSLTMLAFGEGLGTWGYCAEPDLRSVLGSHKIRGVAEEDSDGVIYYVSVKTVRQQGTTVLTDL